MTEPQFAAQVVAAYGRHLRVRDALGGEWDARPFGRRLTIVCGDRVLCDRGAAGEVHAVDVLPRTSALYRSSVRGAAELVVANLDLMLVTVAPLPAPDFFVVDRYLAAATSAGIAAVVVLNKCELADAPSAGDTTDAELDAYRQLGCPVLRTSVKRSQGIDALAAELAAHTGVLVGQSGVGKSSLMKLLARPDEAHEIVTGALTRDDGGSHTTTAARLYDCAGGGHLIDAPGVRDFAPSIEHLENATLGFADVAARAGGCRFQDCRHLREPDCAVRAAVDAGTMSARRYESYRRLRRLVEELRERRGEHGKNARRGARDKHRRS